MDQYTIIGFIASMFLGITAVIVKMGVSGQNVKSGILIRVSAALPILLTATLLIY